MPKKFTCKRFMAVHVRDSILFNSKRNEQVSRDTFSQRQLPKRISFPIFTTVAKLITANEWVSRKNAVHPSITGCSENTDCRARIPIQVNSRSERNENRRCIKSNIQRRGSSVARCHEPSPRNIYLTK